MYPDQAVVEPECTLVNTENLIRMPELHVIDSVLNPHRNLLLHHSEVGESPPLRPGPFPDITEHLAMKSSSRTRPQGACKVHEIAPAAAPMKALWRCCRIRLCSDRDDW
jgi:hypothetical protein